MASRLLISNGGRVSQKLMPPNLQPCQYQSSAYDCAEMGRCHSVSMVLSLVSVHYLTGQVSRSSPGAALGVLWCTCVEVRAGVLEQAAGACLDNGMKHCSWFAVAKYATPQTPLRVTLYLMAACLVLEEGIFDCHQPWQALPFSRL